MAHTGQGVSETTEELRATQTTPAASPPSPWKAIRRQRDRIELAHTLLHVTLNTLDQLDKPRGSVVIRSDATCIENTLSQLVDAMQEAADEIINIL